MDARLDLRMPQHSLRPDDPFSFLDVSGAASGRRVPAWLLSGLVHLIAMLVLAFAVCGMPRGGATVEPDRTGGIVLVAPSQGAIEYLDEAEAETRGASSASAAMSVESPSAADPLPDSAELPVDAAGTLPSENGLEGIDPGGDFAGALPGAGDLMSGTGGAKKVGGGGRTYVFGIAGAGDIFLYVFDRSSSMSGFEGRPLAAAKAELIKSLRSLSDTNQFQIIFYNDRVLMFNPYRPQPPRLMFADAGNKALAERFVRAVTASGGTRHMEPLRIALRLAPDVIFFLTDAADPQLTPTQLRELRRLNKGTVINTIEFGAGPPLGDDNFLVKLARQNDGQHVYVDVSRLPPP